MTPSTTTEDAIDPPHDEVETTALGRAELARDLAILILRQWRRISTTAQAPPTNPAPTTPPPASRP